MFTTRTKRVRSHPVVINQRGASTGSIYIFRIRKFVHLRYGNSFLFLFFSVNLQHTPTRCDVYVFNTVYVYYVGIIVMILYYSAAVAAARRKRIDNIDTHLLRSL